MEVCADDNTRAVRPCTSIFLRSESLHIANRSLKGVRS